MFACRKRYDNYLAIPFMKYFVLAFILLLLDFQSFAQIVTPKEIVKKALIAHTGGKELNQYRLKIEFDTSYSIPKEFLADISSKLDSIRRTLPDSFLKQIEFAFATQSAELYKSSAEEYANFSDEVVTDVSLRKAAWIRMQFNSLTGKTDSSKYIDDINTSYSAAQKNPLGILNYLASDSVLLRYAGLSSVNGESCHMIQVKKQDEWIDVFITEKSHILRRWSEPIRDSDTSKRKRLLQEKQITTYKDFKEIKGFLLPVSVEELWTSMGSAVRKKLTWEGLNEAVNSSLFMPAPVKEESIKFRIHEISQKLHVMEQQSRFGNNRLLIRAGKRVLDLFMVDFNNEKVNAQMIQELYRKFPSHRIGNIYCVHDFFDFSSYKVFFSQNTKLIYPKRSGMDDRSAWWNFSKDTTGRQLHRAGRITTFDKDFKTNTLLAIILNPALENVSSSYIACYFLPIEKVVYFYENPYNAQADSKNARPREKLLYDLIKQRKLSVEKIVYSGAYMDNAPLFMSFNDFEKRILNTDFTIYKN